MGDNSTKAWGGGLVVTLGLIVAMQWKEFFEGIQLAPGAVMRLVTESPFEGLTALLAFFVAACVWGFTLRHPAIATKKPQSGADWSALGSAVIVSMSLCWASGKSAPLSVLIFLYLGITAGVLAAFMARAAWSALAPPKEPKP